MRSWGQRRDGATREQPLIASAALSETSACEQPCKAAIPSPSRNASLFPLMSASVSLQYVARVAAGRIERDSGQQAIVDRLAQLEKRLAERRLAHKSSSLGWLFGARAADIKGLYIFGDV